MAAPTSAKRHHIAYMRPLFRLSNMFGIYEQPGIKPRFFKVYSYLVIVILITSTSISLYYKSMSTARNNTRKYGDIIINFWRTGMNALTLFSLQDSNKLVTHFSDIIGDVDSMLYGYYTLNFAKRQRVFLIEMFIIIVLLTASILYKVYVNLTHNMHYNIIKIINLFVESSNKYIIMIIVLIFYNFVLMIKDRFCFINSKLDRENKRNRPNYSRKLAIFSKSHYLLCEAVEDINGNFGYALFGIISLISLDLTMAVSMIINSLVSYDLSENVHVVYLLLPYIFTCLIFLGFGIMIITSCEQLTKHAFNTSRICYDILLKYPSMGQLVSSEVKIREALLFLAHHACQRKPNITAADFFSVNYYLLGVMSATIVSYVIIFVQMK